jgi:DNA mismatch repair protein MutL
VQFSLRHDGRDLRLWPSVSDPAERVAAVLGREAGGDLWPVAGEAEGRRLRGWIAHPRRFRTSSKGIFLYVNGRWVRDRGIQYALAEAFSGRLMRGQYPLAVLLLDLPCEQVDVNVHPAKSEVRLLDGRPVHALVVSAVRQALARLGRPAATPATVPQAVMEEVEPIAPSGGKPHSPWPPAAGRSVPETLWRRSPGGAGAGDGQPLPIQEEIWAEGPLGTLRVIGQLHNTYLVCEAPRDLVLIDQHAAHERIVFERLRTAHQGRGGERQGLLLPETVELSHREAARLRELLPALERLGLELEPFGGNSFAIKTLPAPLAGASAVPLVTQIAEKALASHSAWDLERAVQDCLILMACHSAVRARQQLSPEEGAALLRQLENCETPACCPHGRPTIIRWPVAALERMFKRSG